MAIPHAHSCGHADNCVLDDVEVECIVCGALALPASRERLDFIDQRSAGLTQGGWFTSMTAIERVETKLDILLSFTGGSNVRPDPEQAVRSDDHANRSEVATSKRVYSIPDSPELAGDIDPEFVRIVERAQGEFTVQFGFEASDAG